MAGTQHNYRYIFKPILLPGLESAAKESITRLTFNTENQSDYSKECEPHFHQSAARFRSVSCVSTVSEPGVETYSSYQSPSLLLEGNCSSSPDSFFSRFSCSALEFIHVFRIWEHPYSIYNWTEPDRSAKRSAIPVPFV